MGRVVASVGLLFAVVSCNSDGETTASLPTSTVPATTAPPLPALDVAACPVADDAFCEAAVMVAGALRAGDVEGLVGLSTEDTIVCAEMNVDFFPDCAGAETLRGYGVSGPDLLTFPVDEVEYAQRLQAMVDATDTADIDAFAVGTCGPDVPGRRTYHLTFANDDGFGSLEMRFDDDWRIVLAYLHAPKAEWAANSPIQLNELFCESMRTPWEA
jgi:hypothetical protein